MNILAVDIGFGSTKVAYNEENTTKLVNQKLTTLVGKLDKESALSAFDQNAFEFNGDLYYVFDKANFLDDKDLLDISDYQGLREASPIILRYLLKQLDREFDMIVLGLSLAMVSYSKDYKEHISKVLSIDPEKIKLVPQGVGAKVSYDYLGLNLGRGQSEKKSLNYLGIDIGYNTVDVFQVIDGSVSTHNTVGIENRGVTEIASQFHSNHSEYSLADCKDIIRTGTGTIRNQSVDHSEEVKDLVYNYIVSTVELAESRFEKTINKMQNIMFVGGGGALIKLHMESLKSKLDEKYPEGFLIIPESPEYYNVYGYYYIGYNHLNQKS